MRLRGTLVFTLFITAAPALAAQNAPPTPNPSPAPSAAQSSLAPYPAATDSPFAQKVHDLLSDPTVSRAHWGIAIAGLDGTPLFGLDEAKAFRPASTAKLFTTAAAMALLGPDTHFTTSVYGHLNATTGLVQGDLVLVGGGDPSFGTNDLNDQNATAGSPLRDLKDLADQLQSKGVRRIAGRVIGDDELFSQEPPPEGWAAEDLVWGYGALPSALSIADNELRLTVRPATASTKNSAAILQVEQAVPYVRLSNNVDTDSQEKTHIDVEPIPGDPRRLAVLGNIAPGAQPVAEHVALPDPAQYAAEALREALSQTGVIVAGRPTARHSTDASAPSFLTALRAPEDCATSPARGADCSVDCTSIAHPDQLLAQHTSGPLAADVAFTLKTSANLHAEMMLRQLKARSTCAGASTVGGARMLRAWMTRAGVPEQDVVLYDGSGLSTKDLVTPRSEVQLLAYATAQPWFPQWKAALPVAGVDGTLSARFTNSPLKGKVFAKTGTLGETRALAGYIQCASGHEVAFSVLVDNHDPGSSADRSTMDKIVEAIAANF